MGDIFFDAQLSKADSIVLQNLAEDIAAASPVNGGAQTTATGPQGQAPTSRKQGQGPVTNGNGSILPSEQRDGIALARMMAMNSPNSDEFEPTVLMGTDVDAIQLPKEWNRWLLQPYIRFARSCVRVETDVVMITHLLLYFSTSVPSAIYLFTNFSWLHGVLHVVMQMYYVGTYTLMMHQHIHQRGILHKRFALFDNVFPYITDPLMGHTWNSYYHHHVKHHHVEGNGPDDLSSTIRYQRDSPFDFACYVARFYFLIWLDLPLYFLRKGKTGLAAHAAFWEMGSYATYWLAYQFNPRATLFVFIIPFLLMRFGLMVGNWGQHALVDADEPDSDYRSSITLIDVPSNRYCFNDGYHTSHHLNPLRHWRDHPVAFLKGKQTYAEQQALVFHNIDYIMMTVKLLQKDYAHLAKCMVPIGKQIHMTMDERMALLQRCTRRFTEEDIRKKFKAA